MKKPNQKIDDSLIKSKARVKNVGEVFTPDFLVERMLDQFPKESWQPGKNWLEPTCGNGQFIVAIIKWKIRAGCNILDALATTFGMDIMTDNVKECKSRIRKEIVDTYIVFQDISGKEKSKLKRVSNRIINNNIIKTKDSLKENWNNKFVPCKYKKV